MLYLQIQQHISLLRHVKPSFGEAQCLHISECKLNNTESLRRCVYHFFPRTFEVNVYTCPIKI